jgi:hypothetical protein
MTVLRESLNDKVGRSDHIYVGSAPGNLESEDFSHEFMSAFNDSHWWAAYGYDSFPNYIVANQKAVIVPPDTNFLMRIVGVQLWVLDPEHKPKGAVQIAKALDRAGIAYVWKTDLRLSGVAAADNYRFPITDPQCILFIGRKPPWSFKRFCRYEYEHLCFIGGRYF